MRIAVFDYKIVPTNPIGGCHLRMLEGLCRQHDFTVFAVRFDNPCPERIRFVRVSAPLRPLALLFIVFHLMAPLCYWFYRLRTGLRFDLIQVVESNCLLGRISYSQFCHRQFLDRHWPSLRAPGMRGWLRWMDHSFHAALESTAYRRATRIVVASQGLGRELNRLYPTAGQKIRIVPNAVDLDRMAMPATFDRLAFRGSCGLQEADLVLVFVALGHFERKGLPLLLKALAQMTEPSLKLVVVGGEAKLVASYQKRADQMGLAGRVVFCGMQADVRPYLWAADAFVLPSAYEVFPLVALEAAAAGLPILAPPLNGVEELLRDGDNGFLLRRTPAGVAGGIGRLLKKDPEGRRRMGICARNDVGVYSTEAFCAGWGRLYDDLQAEGRNMVR